MEYPFKDLLPLDEVLAREGYYKDWTHLDPEVFYSLTQISEYIKTKGYGVDVRLLIAQLAEHFGLKTTQVVDLGNLIQAEHATLKQQVQQAVAQVNADRNALEAQFNQSVAQMEAEKNAVIANVTVDSEVILARGGKATLGQRLDETLVNPEFETESSESVSLGSELINGASVLGEHVGWTVSGNSYTHTTGNTQPLTLDLPISDGLYRIYVDISKPNMADRDGISDYYIQLGGSAKFETYRGVVYSQVWGIRSRGSNTHLVLTPDTNFEGTLTLSVRRIEGTVEPHSAWLDSNNEKVIELRHTKKGSESIYIGNESGQYSMQGDIEQNSSLGHQALKDNTAGFCNSALGARALESNTVGSRNIAIGRVALSDNISGDRNIGVGTFSLRRNTTGRSNIAVGADSLWYNTTGNFNIGIGLLALADNPNGEDNIAIGQSAMAASSGGKYNFAGGFLALNYNKGEHNIALGRRAMYRNLTGDNNVALGNSSLFFNESGTRNIAIGEEALYGNISGGSNIAIGRQSMYRENQGGNNIGIGNYTLFASNGSLHNVAIGSESLRRNIDGIRNVGVGRSTLINFEHGDENTALGNASLFNLATGNNNTGIGRNSGSGLTAGGNNVYLGNTAGSISHESDNNILIGFNAQKRFASGSNELNIGNVIQSRDMTEGLIEIPKLSLTDLPTTEPTQSGSVWNDNGTLKIV